MLTPRPWQIEGARFLASRKTAGLFDDPRVGKTGAALIAANAVGAERVGVITTSSGLPVWQRAFDQWGLRAAERRLVSWGGKIRELSNFDMDVLIVDESHKAANPDSERTKAVYGEMMADGLFHRERSAVARAARVWCLSGTPAPHDNGNWWSMLRSLAPELLEQPSAPLCAGVEIPVPNVRSWQTFQSRYCVMGMKKMKYGPPLPVVIGGRNPVELRVRIGDWFLRRTLGEVGIAEPTYDLLPIKPSDARVNRNTDFLFVRCMSRDRLLAAIDAGDADELDLHLAEAMRLTGEIKAEAVVKAVRDEIETSGKIVLAYWHRSVGDILQMAFAQQGVLRLDGGTSALERATLEALWASGREQVFLNQMEAGGEAIDLSAADQMIIVEPRFSPRVMRQVAMRIVNMGKRRTPLVRVAVLAGSIDEVVQERLLALWAPIKEVLG